ncbi:MAG TPA: hypothetical protein VJS92_07045, partial [Candidatus Polarisedimenticolaceae bacterium]|nr:hypothetical protein [Candidatus Polarisedimenticolaceae bacterium]
MLAYTARVVLPVASPALRDAALTVEDGRIRAVGPRRELLAALPAGTEVRDLGDAIVLPGLVNAHTHLELSWMAGRLDPQLDYVNWVRELLRLRAGEDPAEARAA